MKSDQQQCTSGCPIRHTSALTSRSCRSVYSKGATGRPGKAGTNEELRRKSDDGEIQSVKHQGHFGKIFADEH